MLKQLLATKPITELDAVAKEGDLKRALGPWALTALGIGAIIGTGIFVLTGIAAANNAGPALALSFVVAGAVCALAALCYSEFASMIPVAGSAYSYSYTTMGEGMAWFIGWNLVLEYLVSISAVSVGWSGYATQFVNTALGWINAGPLPDILTRSPLEKGVGHWDIERTGSIINLPAVFIIALVTGVCYRGITQSSTLNAFIVAIKVTVIVLFIAFGVWYVDPANWDPFIPARVCDGAAVVTETCRPGGHYGWFGIVEGASIIFFAYIGFDAVSTAAQEAKNPQRDMPIGIIASLLICTVLYIVVSLILTGMMPYQSFKGIAHPVSFAIQSVPSLASWLAPLVELGAIAGLSSVILVMMIGQPRIFYAMSRDGLLPPVFARVHPRYQTPHINTVITGVIAALLGGFLPIDILAELTNIGTLIAFMSVCIGVLVLRYTRPDLHRPFKVPMPWVTCILGAAGCLYLIYGLPYDTWIRLGVWTVLGALVYFSYGYWNSKLRQR